MNSFLILCIVFAIVSLSCATELRKARSVSFSQKKGLKMQNIAAGSTFPTSPMYAVVETYSDSACTTISYGNSYVLDTCLASASASSKYTCASNVGTMFTYSDVVCGTQTASSNFNVGDCVAYGGAYVKLLSCGTDATAYSTKLVTERLYEVAACTSELIGSNAYPNGYCMDVSDGTDPYSVEIKWPKGYFYASSDCTGSVIGKQSIPTSCQLPGTDDDSTLSYGSYSKVNYGSGAFSNLSFGFGAILSAFMVALQLMKN